MAPLAIEVEVGLVPPLARETKETYMKHWKRAASFAAVGLGALAIAALAGPGTARTQDDGPERFEGTWVLAGAAGAAERDIEQALEAGVENVNFMVRGLALSQLKAKNPLIRSIKVEHENGRFKITFDGNRSYQGPDDGSLQSQRDVQGDRIRVGHRVHNGRLQQIFVSESGRRVNSFSVNGDRMRLSVRVTADILPEAVTYSVTYRKQ